MPKRLNASERTRRGFLEMASRHSVSAAAATEKMITTARLGGIAIDPALIESVRSFFATMAETIETEHKRI